MYPKIIDNRAKVPTVDDGCQKGYKEKQLWLQKIASVEKVAKKIGHEKKEMRRKKFHLWIIVANASRNWTPCYRLVHLGRALNNSN